VTRRGASGAPRGRTARPAAVGASEAATRARLLEAAMRLFAERGVRSVTVRDICKAAGANVAAVNYHFGDKERLYDEVVGQALAAVKEFDAFATSAPEGFSPEEKLRHYVRAHLIRGGEAPDSERRGLLRELFRRELSEPDGRRLEMLKQVFGARWRYLGTLVRGVLGEGAPPDVVARAVLSIQSQCILPLVLPPSLTPVPLRTPAEREQFVEHVVTFSLGGLAAIARGRAGERRVSLRAAPQRSRSAALPRAGNAAGAVRAPRKRRAS